LYVKLVLVLVLLVVDSFLISFDRVSSLGNESLCYTQVCYLL